MSAPALAPTDREALRKQLIAATLHYRVCLDAADEALSNGSPRADHLIGVAVRALRKRDSLLDQWPLPQEPCS